MPENGLATLDDNSIFSLVTSGDCSKLGPQQKLQYYKARCEAAGLDPRTAPFQFLRLQGREVLYALKGATDQMASSHGIRIEVRSQITENDIRTVTVRAAAKDGRQTDEIGCVSVAGLKGDALCNAFMKAVTKAKRRAVLSLCGLGMMDETEIDTIPGAAPLQELPKDRPVTPEDPITDEDFPFEVTPEPTESEEPQASQSESIPSPSQEKKSARTISVPQQKRLFAIATSVGWTTDEMKQALRDEFGLSHSKDITVDQYENIVNFFQTPR